MLSQIVISLLDLLGLKTGSNVHATIVKGACLRPDRGETGWTILPGGLPGPFLASGAAKLSTLMTHRGTESKTRVHLSACRAKMQLSMHSLVFRSARLSCAGKVKTVQIRPWTCQAYDLALIAGAAGQVPCLRLRQLERGVSHWLDLYLRPEVLPRRELILPGPRPPL